MYNSSCMLTILKKSKVLRSILFLFGLILFTSTALLVFHIPTHKEVETEEHINPKQLIVLISLDGFGSNLLGENTPYLESLIQQTNTSYTLDLQTLEQSETMPSHISMVTGLTQEQHQFYANTLDENTPPLTVKTLFDYAIEDGYSYYAFLTKDKLLYLLGDKVGENISSEEANSGDVLDDIDSIIETQDSKVFVFIHLRDIDSYGHQYGWLSDEQGEALNVLDTNLESLISDLRQEFDSYQRYFVITADHGGEELQHSNGCDACRRIPLIVVSENTEETYELGTETKNIYDSTCLVLKMMDDREVRNLDCKK